MTLKTFKRASAAYAAAGDQPLLSIRNGSSSIYVTGLERLTEIAIMGTRPSGARQLTGFITAGHLDRLGNANGAIRTDRRGLGVHFNAFDQTGLMQREAQPLRDAVDAALHFINGFEDDDSQEGIGELLERLRAARRSLD